MSGMQENLLEIHVKMEQEDCFLKLKLRIKNSSLSSLYRFLL